MEKNLVKLFTILFFAIPGVYASISIIQWGFTYPDTLINIGTYIFCFIVFNLFILTFNFVFKIIKNIKNGQN